MKGCDLMGELIKMFMETQIKVNDCNQEKFDIVVKQLEFLVKVVEDHENDMEKMAKKINELEKQISEMKGQP